MLCIALLTRYLLMNTCRHTTLGSTNDRTISGQASSWANNGNVGGDIGAGHDIVCIRTLSIIARAPSHLSLVLGILLLAIVVILI